MLQPTTHMAVVWIVMSPVDDAAFGVPLVFAIKLDAITLSQAVDPWSQVYVVCYQNGLTGSHFQDESLMPRSIQVVGQVPPEFYDRIRTFPLKAEAMVENIQALREDAGLPFLATDRSVLNLPAVGKSLTFRTIGITRYGRRILEFDHDETRNHSPIIHKMGKVVIIESKSIHEYLNQLEEMGEQRENYAGLYGYSMGQTERRLPVYDYPEPGSRVTDEMSNLEL